MKTLIIIPAYNEEENILSVVKELQEKCPRYDYLVVNDCSRDTTKAILEANKINRINHCCNLGIGGGIQSGYLYALENGYDYAVQLDGDGQHDPQYIKNLIDKLESGEVDVAIGSRFIEKQGFQSSGMRRFGIRFLSTLIKIMCGAVVKDVTSGFRAVNRKFIEIFANDYADDYPEPEAIIATRMYGGKIAEVPVVMRERAGGVSSISPLKSVYYMIKVSLAVILYRVTFRGGK